jgi:hypothetical protein
MCAYAQPMEADGQSFPFQRFWGLSQFICAFPEDEIISDSCNICLGNCRKRGLGGSPDAMSRGAIPTHQESAMDLALDLPVWFINPKIKVHRRYE